MEPVTSVLVERSREVQGLPRMVGYSLAAHAGLIVVLLLVPVISPRAEKAPETIMTISLGGAPGPRAGGMTMVSAPKPESAATPARPSKIIMPPAAKSPAMVLPEPAAKPAKPAPKSPSRPAVEPPPSAVFAPPRVPFGAEAAPNPSDPNRGLGFGGLSTGGGAGAGGFLEIANFCCPDYLVTMLQLVQANWRSVQEVSGETQLKFRILRDGRITGIELEKSSGYPALDLEAQRALFTTQRLPPLPPAFSETQLTVHLRFPYQR